MMFFLLHMVASFLYPTTCLHLKMGRVLVAKEVTEKQLLSDNFCITFMCIHICTHTNTYRYICVYIATHICVCVCVCTDTRSHLESCFSVLKVIAFGWWLFTTLYSCVVFEYFTKNASFKNEQEFVAVLGVGVAAVRWCSFSCFAAELLHGVTSALG